MNVWSLNKHDDIRALLLEIQIRFGDNSFAVDKIVEQDLHGISLHKPGNKEIRAYVHTYGQADHLYGMHLEYPSFNENDFAEELKIFDDQSMEQVIDSLSCHFDIVPMSQVVV